MRRLPVLQSAAVFAVLSACSPAPQQAQSNDEPRPTVAAAAAEPAERELAPVLDAEGNELDPELADAVREKMAESAGGPEAEEDPAAAPE